MNKTSTAAAGGAMILLLGVLTIVTWSNGLGVLAVLLAVALVGVGWALVDNLFVYRGALLSADGPAAVPGPDDRPSSGAGTEADGDVPAAPATSAPPPAS